MACFTHPPLFDATARPRAKVTIDNLEEVVYEKSIGTKMQGWNCRGSTPPPFMSTDAHYWVKINYNCHSLCKILNISQFFQANSNTGLDVCFLVLLPCLYVCSLVLSLLQSLTPAAALPACAIWVLMPRFLPHVAEREVCNVGVF